MIKVELTPAADPQAFLAGVGAARTRSELRRRQIVFSQGDPADTVFYLAKGKIELKVLSLQGKEAILAILGAGDFFGEGCLTGQPLRVTTAVAVTECTVMRINKSVIVALLRDEPDFAALFLSHLLGRNADARPRRADHLGQALLADFGDHRFGLPILPEIGQQQQNPRQALFARIEQLVDEIFLETTWSRTLTSVLRMLRAPRL